MSASGMTATDPFDFPLSGDSELTHCASRMAYSTDAQTRVTVPRHPLPLLVSGQLVKGCFGLSMQVEAVRGEGGHILVSATVNDGALEGLFVLDTGSSGLVLDPHIVAKLNLQSVGQHFSTGIDGGIKVWNLPC